MIVVIEQIDFARHVAFAYKHHISSMSIDVKETEKIKTNLQLLFELRNYFNRHRILNLIQTVNLKICLCVISSFAFVMTRQLIFKSRKNGVSETPIIRISNIDNGFFISKELGKRNIGGSEWVVFQDKKITFDYFSKHKA